MVSKTSPEVPSEPEDVPNFGSLIQRKVNEEKLLGHYYRRQRQSSNYNRHGSKQGGRTTSAMKGGTKDGDEVDGCQ